MQKRQKLALYIQRMKGVSPLDKLNQGYSYVAHEGKTLTSIDQINGGDMIQIYVSDGLVDAQVHEKKRVKYS